MPILQPFGSIEIPVGGKLPPAPTYEDGKGGEFQAYWCDITSLDYTGWPSRLYINAWSSFDVYTRQLLGQPPFDVYR